MTDQDKTLFLYGNRHFARFIFPFALKEPKRRFLPGKKPHRTLLRGITRRIEETGDWQRQEGIDPPYILPYVSRFLFSTPETSWKDRYVFIYEQDSQTIRRYLPKGGRGFLVVSEASGDEKRTVYAYGLELEEVQLYLFRSGVGMLMLQIAMREPLYKRVMEKGEMISEPEPLPLTLDQMVHFNHSVRTLEEGKNAPYLYVPTSQPLKQAAKQVWDFHEGKDENSGRRLYVSDLINQLMAPIGQEGDAWEAFYERRLIGYTFALVSRQDTAGRPEPIPYEDLKYPLFWLRRCFDLKYRPNDSSLRLNDNPEVIQTFDNIYFGLSMEGGAVVAWDTGVDYIRNQLHSRVRDSYFLLFLLALHQRLAAIHLARGITETSYFRHSHRPVRGRVGREFIHLRLRLFEFIIRCWFAEVSNMVMYTTVYRGWQQVLQVESLLAEVKNEVEELDDYLQRVQMDRQGRILALITLFFFPVTLITGGWGMNLIELTDPGISITDVRFWLISAVFLSIYLIMAYIISRVFSLLRG